MNFYLTLLILFVVFYIGYGLGKLSERFWSRDGTRTTTRSTSSTSSTSLS